MDPPFFIILAAASLALLCCVNNKTPDINTAIVAIVFSFGISFLIDGSSPMSLYEQRANNYMCYPNSEGTRFNKCLTVLALGEVVLNGAT
jgi:hypothetical protein